MVPNFVVLKNHILENDMDIVGVSETWLHPDYPDHLITIPNYNLIRLDRPTRGGGVAIFLKSTFKFQNFISTLSDTGFEQLWLVIHINKIKVGLGMIYRPPNVSAIFLNELSDSIEQIYLQTESVILMGDININLLNQNNAECKNFLSIISNFHMLQLIDKPTRITNTSQSLIDVICVSENIQFVFSDTYDINDNTDHLLVYCKLEFEGSQSKKKAFIL